MRWLRTVGRIVAWPVRTPVEALAKRAGKKAVEGALEAITPPQKEGNAMLGINKFTNGSGLAVLIWQIVQVVVPLLLPQLSAVQVSPETNVAVSTAILAGGLLKSKDADVTGAGDAARRVK